MSGPAELIAAVLADACLSAVQAEDVLQAARWLDVDPLDFCAHRYGLGVEEAMRRAAAWVGMAFFTSVPSLPDAHARIDHLDALATLRSLRLMLYDRDVLYLAPSFDELVNLRDYAAGHPQFQRTTCLVPASAIRAALGRMNEEELLGDSRQRLSRRWPFALAHLDVGRAARLLFLSALAILICLVALAPWSADFVVLPMFGLLLLGPAVFRLIAVLTRQDTAPRPAPALDDADLPVYSVLIPLCDEAQMVPQLARAMTAMRYPPEKLDIKFVVEARSRSTVEAVRAVLHDPRFELIVVPDAKPRTKPKACNYALPFVRGKYLVVYDAEDVPDPDQLRLAASAFAQAQNVDCLQAELMIDNARENPLTGLFAGEYAGQFGVMMPALVKWELPIPLGGTSNHFSVRALREVGGWDAFNVTEDADLGARLARLRYRAAMLESRTWEEAPIGVRAWMRQRTRWMKGWMQTFIVHNRRPAALLKDLGWRGFTGFELYVGSLILSPILNTVFLGSVLAHFVLTGTPPFTPVSLRSCFEFAVMVVGYGAAFAVTVAGLGRAGQWRLIRVQALLPLYWVLHSIATIRAGYELMTRPHYWAKTTHGLSRERQPAEPSSDDQPSAGVADKEEPAN